MKISQAVQLIKGIEFKNTSPSVWADLGCGGGTFTSALATLLPFGSTVYAVDKTNCTVAGNANARIENIPLNFETAVLPFQNLDGILMANALHFVQHKRELLQKLKGHMKENAQFLMVEYETALPNPWVPFPIPYAELKEVFSEIGFNTNTYLGERPSIYGSGVIYACVLST